MRVAALLMLCACARGVSVVDAGVVEHDAGAQKQDLVWDAGVRGRWAGLAMDLDLRDTPPAVVAVVGGSEARRVTVRRAVDDSLVDGITYFSGVVIEGTTEADGGLSDCRTIATGEGISASSAGPESSSSASIRQMREHGRESCSDRRWGRVSDQRDDSVPGCASGSVRR